MSQSKRAIYTDLMEEVKTRLEAIQVALNGGMNLFSAALVQEFCYLQLRMIAETIAVSCLLAHDDISDTKLSALQGTWEADKIIKTLANLHQDFFPYPVKREHLPDGSIHMNDVPTGYLTRDEVLQLLGRSGNKLHRGSLKNVLKNKNTVQNLFPDIQQWNNKIVRLLNEHRIMFKNGSVYYVALKEGSLNGKALVVLAEPERAAV